MRETLAIVGSHPRAQQTFDFDRDVDVWVFNEAMKMDWVKRADAVFQMHLEAIWRNPNNRNDPNHYEWLRNGNTPTIYMQDVYADVPKSVKYPLDEIVEKYLSGFEWRSMQRNGNKYFSSTFCYALALAVHVGYRNIEMHGVELETDTEYRYQRDGVTFWIGIAIGRGVKITAFCNIFDFPLYGYEGEAALNIADMHKRIEELKPLLERQKEEYDGIAEQANNAVVRFLNNYENPADVVDLLKKQAEAAYKMNVTGGAIQENEKYIGKARVMQNAAGDFQFSRQEFEMAARSLAQSHADAVRLETAYAGACDVLFKKSQHKNQIRRKNALREFAEAARKYIEQRVYAGLFQGAMEENVRYLKKLDSLIKAAGGAKSEAVLLESNHVQLHS